MNNKRSDGLSSKSHEAMVTDGFVYLYTKAKVDPAWYKREIWHAINNLSELHIGQEEIQTETKKRIKEYQEYFNETFPTSEVEFNRVFC